MWVLPPPIGSVEAAGVNVVPLPLPRKMLTCSGAPPEVDAAKSAMLSLLKSPVTTLVKVLPATLTVVGAPRPPDPLPSRTARSFTPTVTSSVLLSPLKSAVATARAPLGAPKGDPAAFAKFPPPSPSSRLMLESPLLAVRRSAFPPPWKKSATMPCGVLPVLTDLLVKVIAAEAGAATNSAASSAKRGRPIRRMAGDANPDPRHRG